MDAATYYKQISKINAQNNAISQQNAREQMQFQDYMSSTAHQREVKDLKAAGLNPVLSAGGTGGGGAATGTGAMGQTDMSAASALTGYLQSLISQQTAIQVASINAGATKYAADKAYESAQNNVNTNAGLLRVVLQRFGILPDADGSAGQQKKVENNLQVLNNMLGNTKVDSLLNSLKIVDPTVFNILSKQFRFFVNGGLSYDAMDKWLHDHIIGKQYITDIIDSFKYQNPTPGWGNYSGR